jgi:hypothetical protein
MIYCCGCQSDVEARLTNGAEIYPHRPELQDIPFWRCDGCGNYVGCHHKTSQPTQPLGVIPTPELRQARQALHEAIDPLWKSGRMNRKQVYALISQELNYRFHTANVRNLAEVNRVHQVLRTIKQNA